MQNLKDLQSGKKAQIFPLKQGSENFRTGPPEKNDQENTQYLAPISQNNKVISLSALK